MFSGEYFQLLSRNSHSAFAFKPKSLESQSLNVCSYP